MTGPAASVPARARTLTFWGVRAGLPCSGPDYVRHGGNTACLEARIDDRLIVFDAGTGLRVMGNALNTTAARIEADIFLTHTRLDHVGGLPFFTPFYRPDNAFRLWAGRAPAGATLADSVDGLMRAPLFPVPPAIFNAQIAYRDFTAGETVALGRGLAMRTARARRRDGAPACAYRLQGPGHALAYVPGTDPPVDPALVELARGADMLVCALADRSAALDGARALAARAGVRRLILAGFDPDLDDRALSDLAAGLDGADPPVHVAEEGERLSW